MRITRRAALAVLLLVLGFASAPTDAAAQAPIAAPARWWLAGGIGGGGSAEVDGGAVLLQLVHQRGPHHFALRGLLMADVWLGADDTMGDLGVLYGRTLSSRGIGHLAAAAGVAYTEVQGCDDPNGCATVGVPVTVELALTPLEFFGVGAQLFGNVNPNAFFGGAAILLQLGWMP